MATIYSVNYAQLLRTLCIDRYRAALQVFDGLYDVLSREIVHKGKKKKAWKTVDLYCKVAVGQRDAIFGYYGIPDEEYLPLVDDSLYHRHALAFLRPLRSARRFMIPNKFPEYGSRNILPYKNEPPYLSLEASIHRALFWHFDGVAVGGYYDPFGMGRATIPIVFEENSEEGHWKQIVKILISVASIVVLIPFESEGIWWELEHINLTGQFNKTMFVMVPNCPNQHEVMTEALDDYGHMSDSWSIVRDRLRVFGIHLPEYDERGGFLFIDSRDSSVMEKTSFDSLWSGALLDNLLNVASRK
ncbi:MAG: hypothetical protein ACRD8U_06090 [Pyrinomonadaceae bacterium]